jgi:tetratricopeptide (TPR) repeat protein
LNRYEEAIASYDRTLALVPKADAAWFNRGLALASLKRYKEAITSFDEALRINPKNADARENRDLLQRQVGQRSKPEVV